MPKQTAPMAPALEGLPERLRQAREDLGLGCNELDRKASVGGGMVSRIENGKKLSGVAGNVLLRLADALGVRSGWLLAGEKPIRDDGKWLVIQASPEILQMLRQAARELPAAGTRAR
jgi:transcriptional regulator with XRE-family HTH domain